MDLLIWLAIGFITIGFIVLIFLKRSTENKVAFIKENIDHEENSIKAKSVIWWIWGTTAWGLISIFLVIWCFQRYFE